MKALVKTKKGQGFLEIRELPIPEINDNEVLVKVHYGGICGTDIHIYTNQFPIYYPPVILGHEFSGEITKLGKKVNDWEIGDRVVGECQSLVCGKCRFCRTGHPEACTHKRSPGWGIDGAFADYIKIPAWLLHKIPDNVSFKQAALTEPAAVSSQALFARGNVKAGDFVVVLGSGPIGIIIARLAQIAGASQVLITGINKDEEHRFLLAKKIGIKDTINIQKVNLKEVIDKLTNNTGADLVVEAAGVEPTINQAFDIVRKLGKIAVIGVPGEEKINVKWLSGSLKAIDISFSFSSQYEDWVRILNLFKNGTLDLTSLATHEYLLDDWEIAFKKALDCEGGKVLFKIHP
jgi:L-iditol 2-dehydrogenase